MKLFIFFLFILSILLMGSLVIFYSNNYMSPEDVKETAKEVICINSTDNVNELNNKTGLLPKIILNVNGGCD